MPSIFDPGVPRDEYVEHMRRTMEWIEERIRDHRREPSHRAYHTEIGVEAQWLQQLIVECLAKHQMLMEYQKALGAASAHLGWERMFQAPPAVRVPAAKEAKDGE